MSIKRSMILILSSSVYLQFLFCCKILILSEDVYIFFLIGPEGKVLYKRLRNKDNTA